MNEAHYDSGEPVISANAGWEEMQVLLNEYLPVKRPGSYRKFLSHYSHAAIIITVFLFSFYRLESHLSIGTGTINRIDFLPLLKKPFNAITALNAPGNSLYGSNKFLADRKRPAKIKYRPLPYPENFSPDTGRNLDDSLTEIKTTPVYITKHTIEEQAGTIIIGPAKMPNANIAFCQGKNEGPGIKASWQLFGGVGINTGVNHDQDLQPFPIAEAKYNINPRIYIAAGLSAWSPVAGRAGGISKTIYLNDTVNNIRLYNETTTYSHLRYVDMPVSAGIKLTKNIAVQAGIQMSVLLSKKITRLLSPYDFQMNRVPEPSAASLVAALPGMEKDYDVRVRKIDYRFIAGVRYAIHKTVIGLTYQHGLQSISSGTYINKASNDVLTLQALFQLK